ncbi:Aerobic-type carbon monoxide dehydrogenase,middle subunit CoxM/CutM homologs [[Clostridium] ultunense Esp]|nr:Aerobic-type carbon monoxide dehydrogenase,middle subunit CoxM/CutM homologs [[Clostridium] ultunense Esp]
MGKLDGFDYIKPNDIEEACKIMAQEGKSIKPFAGGTDLMVQMRAGKIKPELLMDIKGLRLDKIQYLPENKISIGALSTINSIIESELIRSKFPFIIEAAEEMASVQIRNRGTVGGNLCNAAPSADLAQPILATGGIAKVVGENGSREMDLDDFFIGPGKTALSSKEILTEIILDELPEYSGTAYIRLKRNAMDLALAGVATVVTIDEEGKCISAKIVLGAVGPTPIIAEEAANSLIETKLDKLAIEKAASIAEDLSKPIDDVRTNAWYRKKAVKNLTIKALELANRRAAEQLNANTKGGQTI